MAIWQPISEDIVRDQVRHLKEDGRDRMRASAEMAIDYIEERMIDHVEGALRERFSKAQSGSTGANIKPFVLPLTQRFVAEAAQAYNRTVEYKLVFVNEDGQDEESEATERLTSQYNRNLEDAAYNENMHLNDQLVVALKANAVWHQAKRGKLRVVPTFVHDVYPIAPTGPEFIDARDPDDYAAFMIELFWAQDDDSLSQKKTYAHLTNAETRFYEGRSPTELDELLSVHPNPFKWMQTVDRANDDGTFSIEKKEAPGRMLTFWHDRLQLTGLLPDTDYAIVHVNHEINIALSMLMDVLHWQGYAIPVLKANNPTAKANRAYGMRFPVALNINEDFGFVNAGAPFNEIVQTLQFLVQYLAVSVRMSPNDFSPVVGAAASGFAKMVDSLPKLEAREDRLTRRKHMEEKQAGPRNIAIMTHQGILDASAQQLQVRVKFPGIHFPKSEDEKTKSIERRTKYNLTTPAQVLAEERGITEAAAQEIIDANAEVNKSNEPPPQDGGLRTVGNMFGGLIGRPNRGENGDTGRQAPRRD